MAVSALAGRFGENHYEQTADSVTKAIMANDMRPVEADFNAIVRPKLLNRAYVGELSDELNALGQLKRIHETTARDTAQGEHTFDAVFEKSTWKEVMKIDSDGKISAFYVHPPSATRPERSERGRRDRHVRGTSAPRHSGCAASPTARRSSPRGRSTPAPARRSRSSAKICSGWGRSSSGVRTTGSRS